MKKNKLILILLVTIININIYTSNNNIKNIINKNNIDNIDNKDNKDNKEMDTVGRVSVELFDKEPQGSYFQGHGTSEEDMDQGENKNPREARRKNQKI